jgi:hypothetical protein
MAPILPWLRSIDALNTHDASYELAIAGGVTTAQILPGSANNIGSFSARFFVQIDLKQGQCRRSVICDQTEANSRAFLSIKSY